MDGPWMSEPTRFAFVADGLPCRMERKGAEHPWRGYVGIPPSHSCYGLADDGHLDALVPLVEGRRMSPGDATFPAITVMFETPGRATPTLAFVVHGGLSYSGYRLMEDWPDGFWWYGFDCGHCFDVYPLLFQHSPSLAESYLNLGCKWRDVEYVESETRHLAEQLAAVVALVRKDSGEKA